MKSRLPWMQWFPRDWISDMAVQSLSFEERGIWWEILQHMHSSEDRGKMVINGVPMSDQDIANIIHCDVAKLCQTLSKLLSKSLAKRGEGGELCNERMVSDEKMRQKKALAGSLGGKQKASKRQANGKQKSTYSVVSSHKSVVINEKTDPPISPPLSAESSPPPPPTGGSIAIDLQKPLPAKELLETFEVFWKGYPQKGKVGKKNALRHYRLSVKNQQDVNDLVDALDNYLKCKRVKDGFIQNGSTWFNNWRDWINYKDEI